jgi:hypothetical protein
VRIANISLYSFVLKVLLEVTLHLADYFFTVNEEETVIFHLHVYVPNESA